MPKPDFSNGNASMSFPFTPVSTYDLKSRDKKAEAILRRLTKQTKNMVEGEHPYLKSKNVRMRSMKAGGIQSSSTRMIGSKGTSLEGRKIHDLEFHRDTLRKDDSYEPRKNISPKNAKLRQANVKFQTGQLLNEVRSGEVVEAQPVESQSGKNPRARIYDRMTKGALKSQRIKSDGFSYDQIMAGRGDGDDWINSANKGKVVKFNPNDLKKPLMDMAAKSIAKRLAGPQVQAAMFVDDTVAGMTGHRPSEKIKEGFEDTIRKNIEKRMKMKGGSAVVDFSSMLPF